MKTKKQNLVNLLSKPEAERSSMFTDGLNEEDFGFLQ